jgi:hypothetical protein
LPQGFLLVHLPTSRAVRSLIRLQRRVDPHLRRRHTPPRDISVIRLGVSDVFNSFVVNDGVVIVIPNLSVHSKSRNIDFRKSIMAILPPILEFTQLNYELQARKRAASSSWCCAASAPKKWNGNNCIYNQNINIIQD